MNTMSECVIVVNLDVMNGTPCFRGTRVPFKNLIDYLEGGHSLDEFLAQFPTASRITKRTRSNGLDSKARATVSCCEQRRPLGTTLS